MTIIENLLKKICSSTIKKVKIGDIATLVTKQTGFDYSATIKPSLVTDKNDDTYPYIQTKNFEGRKFNYNTDFYIPTKTANLFPKIILNEKCILVSIVGSIGNVGLYPGDKVSFLGGAICVIKLKKDVNVNYVYYCLESPIGQKQLSKKTKGSGQSTVTIEDIRNFEIPLPSIEIQNEISDVLDSFSALNARMAEELENRKMQFDFYRNKAFLFNNSDKTMLCNKRISDLIVSLKTGLNPRQNFKLNVEGATCPYITGKDIFENRIIISDRTDKITPEAVVLINKRAKLEDDILLFASTGTGTVGRMAYIEKYDGTWNLSETLYCIKTKKEILPKYLMHFLYSSHAREQFDGKISKGSVPHLKVSDLLNVEVPVVALDLQQKIIDDLEAFNSYCNDSRKGLLAEILLRQKQYEYYRDLLLDFKE